MPESFLNIGQVVARCGIGRTTVFALMAQGKFPPSRKLRDARCTRWLASDIDGWIASQVNHQGDNL